MASTNVVVAGVQARDVVVSTSSQVHLGSVTRGLRWNVATHSSVTLRSSSPARSLVVRNAGEDSGETRKRNTGNAMSSTVYSGNGIEEKINWNRAQLAYVIVYVSDVNKAADFYNKAFGLDIRPQNKSSSWVEMETGATTLAFTPENQHETELTGGLVPAGNNRVMINLDFSNVEAAYKHAISQGATAVAAPEDKNWPQKVGYVKDIDGNIVRLGSFPAM